MSFKYEATRRKESVECPGVTYVLRRMTEGRRMELRKQLGPTQAKIREVLREQGRILELPTKDQDLDRLLELQDEYDEAMLTVVNPATIKWGVKQVEGLEVDGKTLGIDEWEEWPSHLFNEILGAVQDESALNGAEIKNLQSPGTSGAQADSNPESTTVISAEKSVVT